MYEASHPHPGEGVISDRSARSYWVLGHRVARVDIAAGGHGSDPRLRLGVVGRRGVPGSGVNGVLVLLLGPELGEDLLG